jgi:uncharacterized glyoxalase superfamily protein PhnB
MALINPHINFNGNAEEAFNFTNQYLAESSQKLCVSKTWQVMNSQFQNMKQIK